VGLAKLLVNNVALVLRADDLRFSPAEVDRFFASARDLKMSSEEVDAIYRRTEGWPAALQLYRLTLVSPEVRNSLDDIGTYSPRELRTSGLTCSRFNRLAFKISCYVPHC